MLVPSAQEWQEILTRQHCLFPYRTPLPYHFVGTSDNHLGGYGNLDPALCDPLIVWLATGQFATAFGRQGSHYRDGNWPEVVVVPAIGEIALMHPTATQLTHDLPTGYIGAVWADKIKLPGVAGSQYRIERPMFDTQVRGKRALVVLDFSNTMHTAKKLIAEVERLGGRVVGICAVVYNPAAGVPEEVLGVPFFGLCPFEYPIWTPDECAASGPCSEGVPIVVDKPLGHGARFRANNLHLPGERFVSLLTP